MTVRSSVINRYFMFLVLWLFVTPFLPLPPCWVYWHRKWVTVCYTLLSTTAMWVYWHRKWVTVCYTHLSTTAMWVYWDRKWVAVCYILLSTTAMLGVLGQDVSDWYVVCCRESTCWMTYSFLKSHINDISGFRLLRWDLQARLARVVTVLTHSEGGRFESPPRHRLPW
jgi:hypothetical protein